MWSSLVSFASCTEDVSTKGYIEFTDSRRPHHHCHVRYNPDEDDYDPANMVIEVTPADALRLQMSQLEVQLQKLRWASGAQSSAVRDRSTVGHYEVVAREIEEELRLLDKELQTLNELDKDHKVFFTEEMLSNLDKALMEHMDTNGLGYFCMKSSKQPIFNRSPSNTSTTASLATSAEHFECEQAFSTIDI